MKSFGERNLFVIGLVGIIGLTALIVTAMNYQKLPMFSPGREYTAYFDEAGGLADNAEVQVSGFASGEVTGISLEDQKVLVKFKVDKKIRLGDRTEAASISVTTPRLVDLTVSGSGSARADKLQGLQVGVSLTGSMAKT